MIIQCGGANKTLPDKKVSQAVTIRCEDLASAVVNIKLGAAASSTDAEMFLLAGDAIEIPKERVNNANEINLINIGAPDPKMYIDIH